MAKFSLEQYESLKNAYAQGVLTVKYTDKQVTYRSAEEMAKILLEMEYDLGIRTNNGYRVFASHSKGLN